MTVTVNGYHGTVYNPIVKPYKVYAVVDIIPHPLMEGVSILRKKNGQAVVVRTQDIIHIRTKMAKEFEQALEEL